MLDSRDAQQIETAETVRRMAAGVFHSLNNLFATLLTHSSLLLLSLERGRWTPAELTEGLQIIARHVTRGSEILRRLRALTGARAEQPVTRVEVNGVIREVVALTDSLIRQARTRSVPIEVRLDLEEVPPVVGRPSELVEVLVNLIVNAIEAMPEGGILTLESTLDGNDVLLRVADTGVGIADEIKAQLFTPFFTTKAGGTGLGLSVSREIVRRHGGDLLADSIEGEGSHFTIRLPAATGSPGKTVVPPPGWRVLVVDDDRFFREVLVEVLATAGYEVKGAAGGQEALACLKREPYDLVLADIVMPDITGWEVARAARAHDPTTVVILFSARSIRPEDPSLREIGANAFLEKPFRVPELIGAVRAALANRRETDCPTMAGPKGLAQTRANPFGRFRPPSGA
ncbi:MAG: response regulator [Candidatus Rokubacteria bacterium]|nr:response regulator [Candidatus Rokubacteria bacterium]